ncbi:tripartite-type tricarboxylate transporter receptor subunit TctC [Acidovorax sp. 56]|uniref:Bug family tripartite tricarboxylate transporter substrate binding protein n=1 Tax=Acidovorax sp. 56 TaxID=2035205 RepID=UPI000C170EFD|nr:Bug family tripartite tricarboxylate transporter substrate binding protein [Acidovorax sp. 56]PIF28336.1 tripartite-type tricarboxylate transporter receptor subunit TctC [Acidovorax sp. 56]
MTTRRQFVQAFGSAAALGALYPLSASAQPVEQVKVLFGFPAGSSGDTVARRVAEKFLGTAYSKNAGVVENKPGAGGRIALEALKAAPADGSVLAVAQVSAIANYPHIYSKMNYTDKDFAPVSIGAIMHHGLAVGPMVPASVKTVKDFLAWAKANPKEASYGSPGAGSTPHFLGALLGINSGVELRHVPYRGSIPGVTDVVGGQIAAMVTPHGDFIANYKAGKIRILATSGPKRSMYVPDVPTFAEQGFPELTTEEWFGFYAPAATPKPIIAAANAAINAALKEKSVTDSLAIVGLIPHGTTPEEMARWQKAEYDTWGPLIKKIGFTAES